MTTCPAKSLGGLADGILNRHERNKKAHLKRVYEELQKDNPNLAPFGIYVYGHTHKAEPPTEIQIDAYWKIVTVNDGAFQRVATPQQLGLIQTAKGWSDSEVLLRARPEDLPACYSYVRIEAYDDRPNPCSAGGYGAGMERGARN